MPLRWLSPTLSTSAPPHSDIASILSRLAHVTNVWRKLASWLTLQAFTASKTGNAKPWHKAYHNLSTCQTLNPFTQPAYLWVGEAWSSLSHQHLLRGGKYLLPPCKIFSRNTYPIYSNNKTSRLFRCWKIWMPSSPCPQTWVVTK